MRKFSERNRVRCESEYGFNHPLNNWSLSDWFTATMGELGEAANVAKKLNRVRDGIPGNGDAAECELRQSLADEIADTFIYLDLLAQSEGFDLLEIAEAKFAETSKKIGYLEQLVCHNGCDADIAFYHGCCDACDCCCGEAQNESLTRGKIINDEAKESL